MSLSNFAPNLAFEQVMVLRVRVGGLRLHLVDKICQGATLKLRLYHRVHQVRSSLHAFIRATQAGSALIMLAFHQHVVLFHTHLCRHRTRN